MSKKPFDVSPVLPDSIAGDEAVEQMAEAMASVGMDPGLPAVLWTYLEAEPDPPDAILNAIAADLHVDDWRASWTTSEKQEALKDAIKWHRAKGTPEGIRWTLERAGIPHATIFERWDLLAWLLTKTEKRFDTGLADVEALDQFERTGPFDIDEELDPFAFWVAIRPGWGYIEGDSSRPDPVRIVQSSQRVAAERLQARPSRVVPEGYDSRSESPEGLVTSGTTLVASMRPQPGVGRAVAVERGTENYLSSPADFTGDAWDELNASVSLLDESVSGYDHGVFRITDTTFDLNHGVLQWADQTTFGAQATVSVFLRQGTVQYGYVFIGPDSWVVVVDLATGTLVHQDAGIDSVAVKDWGEGWYRVEVTLTPASGDRISAVLAGPTTKTDGTTEYAGDGTGYIDAAMAQVEHAPRAAPFATGTRPEGRLALPEALDPERWGVSMWVDVAYPAAETGGRIWEYYADDRNVVWLSRDGSGLVFEITEDGSFETVTAAVPEGPQYLTVRHDEGTYELLQGTTVLASLTTSKRARPFGTMFLGPERPTGGYSNWRVWAPMVWRKAPTGADLAAQAGRTMSFEPLRAGVWPARPRDLNS